MDPCLAKHPEITETILARIKDHQYGRKLPPVRKLAAEFSVSTRTMQKAMTSLINSQWIIPNGSGGNWINYQKSIRKKNGVVCVFTNFPCRKDDPLVEGIAKLIRESGRQLLLADMPDLSKMTDYKTVSRMPVDGFIFLFSSISQQLCDVLTLAEIPFVCANQLPANFLGSWCDFDYRNAYREIVRLLLASGISRIAFHDLPHFSGRQDGIKNIWKELMDEFNIPRRFRFPVLGKRSSASLEIDLDAHLENLFSRRDVPQAVICRSGASEYLVEKIISRYGLRVPEDVRVYELNRACCKSPAEFIDVSVSYRELAGRVWQIFLHKLQGNENISGFVEAKLISIQGFEQFTKGKDL